MPPEIDTKDTKPQNSGDATVESRAPSIRESIMAAVEEHANDEPDTKDVKENKDVDTKDKDENKDDKVAKDDSSKATDESKVIDKTIQNVDSTEPKDKQVKEEKAPSILPKEVQQDWGKFSVEHRAYLTKTQKELADTKAELGRRTAASKDLDDAIAPYQGSIQNLGLTPGQTVSRLFQWMDALSGPNKYDAIFKLAENFGIDLDSVYSGYSNTQNQQDQNQNQNQNQQQYQEIDPRLAEAMYGMYNEINEMKAGQQRQKQQSAAATINNWAGLQPDGTFSKKPYFDKVRQSMLGLLTSGAIPLVNGNLDLDTAYDQACYSNPEIRQELLAQQESEKQAQAAEAAKKKAEEDKAKAAKAAKLNVSLRPTSPTGEIAVRKPNSKGDNSIRNSIYEAIREVNN